MGESKESIKEGNFNKLSTLTSLKTNKPANNIPFLPDDWKTKIYKLQKQGYKSEWRNLYFESLCKMKQSKLKRHLEECLKSNNYSSIENADGYLYAKGDIPVMLVAHMDTVHKELPKNIIYKDEYVMSPQGIGGDDRCGIYMVLQVIKDFKCHVVFTEDEEIGCVGASKFAKSETAKSLKGTINYIVEFDRKGKNDAVYYDLRNFKFQDFIEPSGGFFSSNWGSCSDICEIAPAINAAAVNFSCGYYQAHTVDEYVNLKEMYKVIEEAKKIIAVHDTHYDYESYTSMWKNYDKYYGRYSGYFDDDDYYYDSYYGSHYRHDSKTEYAMVERQEMNLQDYIAEQEYAEYIRAQDKAYWKDKYDSKNEKNIADDEMIYEDGEWKKLYGDSVNTYEIVYIGEDNHEYFISVEGDGIYDALLNFFDTYTDVCDGDVTAIYRI